MLYITDKVPVVSAESTSPPAKVFPYQTSVQYQLYTFTPANLILWETGTYILILADEFRLNRGIFNHILSRLSNIFISESLVTYLLEDNRSQKASQESTHPWIQAKWDGQVSEG